MTARIRFTIRCKPDALVLAARAARYGLEKMPNDSAIVVYGDDVATFYVKRTKAGGISVTQEMANDCGLPTPEP